MINQSEEAQKEVEHMGSSWFKITLLDFLVVVAIIVIPLWYFRHDVWCYPPTPKVKTARNMKSVSFGLYESESSFMKYPDASIRDEAGKPLLSWRVLLLPYLGHAELFNEFKLDEPWDSEHNKKLISRMPFVYENHFDREKVKEFRTNLLFPVSVGVPENQSTMFSDGNGRTREEIADGTSETIMLVVAEDDRSVIWTKPGDLPFNPEDPANGLKILDNGNFMVMTMEGRVTYHSPEISREKLLSLFTCSGNDPVEEEKQ